MDIKVRIKSGKLPGIGKSDIICIPSKCSKKGNNCEEFSQQFFFI